MKGLHSGMHLRYVPLAAREARAACDPGTFRARGLGWVALTAGRVTVSAQARFPGLIEGFEGGASGGVSRHFRPQPGRPR